MKNIITYFSQYGRTNDVNDGGNFEMALAYLSSWLGPVLETDDPYDAQSALSAVFNSTVHVQNALFLKRNSYTDNDEIKKAILNYGAVSTSMMYDDRFLIDDKYYYCGVNYESDHAVTIVGWDEQLKSEDIREHGLLKTAGELNGEIWDISMFHIMTGI